MSVNDGRGPSIDSRTTKTRAKARAKKLGPVVERLAHRGCNTGKGAVAPVVRWADHLFVVDPAPIIASVERLGRKGGREVMARCPTEQDADDAAAWLVDRVTRLEPGLQLAASAESGGGQYLVIATA